MDRINRNHVNPADPVKKRVVGQVASGASYLTFEDIPIIPGPSLIIRQAPVSLPNPVGTCLALQGS